VGIDIFLRGDWGWGYFLHKKNVLNVCGFRVIYDTRRVRIIVVNKMRGLEYIARKKNDCACVCLCMVCVCLGVGGSADCVGGFCGAGVLLGVCLIDSYRVCVCVSGGETKNVCVWW
jgi:hypothetical protein